MGLKIQKTNLSSFAREPSSRFDFSYVKSVTLIEEDYYTYKDLFEVIPSVRPLLNEDQPFRYAEIGNVSKLGEVFPVTLDYNDRDELNEDKFKKIEKGDIILPDRGNILISTVRPYLNKVVLIEDSLEMDKSPIYFTKAFIQIKPKVNSKILYYLLRTIFHESINAVSRQGKGYPTLKEGDLKTIRFPKKIIDTLLANEDELISKLDDIILEIKDFNSIKREKGEIVDEIFAEQFKIDLDKIISLDKQRRLNVEFAIATRKNSNMRTSYRWNKMSLIQEYLYKNIKCIKPLGKYITHINNGWSPESVEGGEGIPVLGQEHFQFNGILDVSPTKATTKKKNNISNFFIQQGDFFVSRGNTVGLVGLASIVEKEIEEDIIYPDLYIRVYFSKGINPKYIALLFNSFFGRLYFKYVSKGKNQSMVKISRDEILNFYLPLPSREQQDELVHKVENLVNHQLEINIQIEQKHNQIKELIKGNIIPN